MMWAMEPKNFERLGEAIRARRAQLGMTQQEVAQGGGPSDVTLSAIEQGTPRTYHQRTKMALERALRWRSGAVESILAGEDPAGWELPETPLAAENPTEVTSAGMGFLALLDKHYGTDPDVAAVRQVVILFIKKINEGVH
jgi:transcriptional regulator with XRE-family HTH domain